MKRWIPFLAAAVLAAAFFAGKAQKFERDNDTIVSGMQVNFLSMLLTGNDMEDIRMQVVYQLARRSIAKVAVKDSAGSGIVWKINDEGIIIVSNKHLLMKDVAAKVTFCNGESADAQMLGYSQQYDIGFLKVDSEKVTANILRDIYEAVPVEYETREEYACLAGDVLQIGADLSGNKEHFSTGSILGIEYEPLFNTDVLKTKCYSRAGMSGGGVFDAGGRLLGMISGGEVEQDAQIREAEVSYSIPVMLIADEFECLNE